MLVGFPNNEFNRRIYYIHRGKHYSYDLKLLRYMYEVQHYLVKIKRKETYFVNKFFMVLLNFL